MEQADRERERLSQKTFERAVNLLTYRARSVEELRGRLMEKSWSDAAIVDQVIEKLRGYGYLNDQEFARDFAQARLRQKPVGRRVLQQKLRLKKLDSAIVERALDESFEVMPERDLIVEAIERRVRGRGLPESREDQKKLFDYLMRQGFSSSLVSGTLRELRAAGR